MRAGTSPPEAAPPLRDDMMDSLARSDVTVLIRGETGSGKGVLAQRLHRSSRRRAGPFVVADCSAIPGSLFESQMFGHVKGAFTGAATSRKGLVRSAEAGTLFLDEVGELPMECQAKLLTLIEDRSVQPVGGESRVGVDFRLIAATHRDLPAMVRQGAFREDLYYRLAVIETSVPPLRERREDLSDLVMLLIERKAALLRVPPREPSEAFMQAVMSYEWPGNIRELGNCIERALVLSSGPELEVQAMPPAIIEQACVVDPSRRKGTPSAHRIEREIERASGNKSEAARRLGVSRRHLYRLLERCTA